MRVEKSQFKRIAEIMMALEKSVQELGKAGEIGMPVASVDLLCKKIGMTWTGAEALVAMINQSDLVAFSEDRDWIIPRPHTYLKVIDVPVN